MYVSKSLIGLGAVALTALTGAIALSTGSYGLARRDAGVAPLHQLLARYAEPEAYYDDEDDFDLYARDAEPEEADEFGLFARDVGAGLYDDLVQAIVRRGHGQSKEKGPDLNKPLPPLPNPQTNRRPVANPNALTVHHPTPQEQRNAKATHRKPVPPPKDR